MTEPFDKKKYDIEYAKAHITRKFIAFNDQNPEDKELLDYIATIPNFTQYVKALIRSQIGSLLEIGDAGTLDK